MLPRILFISIIQFFCNDPSSYSIILSMYDCSLGNPKLVLIFLTRACFQGYDDPSFVDAVSVLPVQNDPIWVLLTAHDKGDLVVVNRIQTFFTEFASR